MSAITFTQKLAEHFRSHPNQWINGLDLAQIAGSYAWRSRVSDVRRQMGLCIENRQRKVERHDPLCSEGQWAGDQQRPCDCDPVEYTVSEYRFVPSQPAGQADLFQEAML